MEDSFDQLGSSDPWDLILMKHFVMVWRLDAWVDKTRFLSLFLKIGTQETKLTQLKYYVSVAHKIELYLRSDEAAKDFYVINAIVVT